MAPSELMNSTKSERGSGGHGSGCNSQLGIVPLCTQLSSEFGGRKIMMRPGRSWKSSGHGVTLFFLELTLVVFRNTISMAVQRKNRL